MSSELVRLISLEDVCTSSGQISNYLQLARMSRQMQRGPHLAASRYVQVEWFQPSLNKSLVQFDNGFYAFLLTFPHRCVNRCPMIIVSLIRLGAIHGKQLKNVAASLRILGEDIHYEMKRSVAVRVLLIQVGFLVYERLYDRDFEPDNSKMYWTSKDSSTQIDICSTINQALCRLVVLLPDGQAQWRAAILIKQVCVGFVHQ
jgi:hypothetical protein